MVFDLHIESLLVARQKSKKALYISDLDDDDQHSSKKKKLKTSIECPIYSSGNVLKYLNKIILYIVYIIRCVYGIWVSIQ